MMRRLYHSCSSLLLAVVILLSASCSHGFQTTFRIAQITRGNRETILRAHGDGGDDIDHHSPPKPDDPPPQDVTEKLDNWLDTPFFDPMAYEDDDDSTWQARLASAVKSDYYFVELVYAGTFLVFMLIVSQELFRMQLYGADYVPFTSNSQTVNPLWKSI